MAFLPTQLEGFMIRPATSEDCPLILSFIRALARYEKLEHQVEATEALLRQELFPPPPPTSSPPSQSPPPPPSPGAARVLLGYYQGEAVAFALYFHNFSTFLGRHGLYVEDLFVVDHVRRLGIGRAMLAYLAHLATTTRSGRMEWVVLDWNRSASEFYASVGAVAQPEWRIHRLTGSALVRLGQEFAPENKTDASGGVSSSAKEVVEDELLNR